MIVVKDKSGETHQLDGDRVDSRDSYMVILKETKTIGYFLEPIAIIKK